MKTRARRGRLGGMALPQDILNDGVVWMDEGEPCNKNFAATAGASPRSATKRKLQLRRPRAARKAVSQSSFIPAGTAVASTLPAKRSGTKRRHRPAQANFAAS